MQISKTLLLAALTVGCQAERVAAFGPSSLRRLAPRVSKTNPANHKVPFVTRLKVATIDSNSEDKPAVEPSWQDILEVPIRVDTKAQFESLTPAKRVAIVSRSSVLHLTLLSCFGPFILRGAIRSATPAQASMALTPGLAALWTLNVLSWHAFHNLLNDWQDLEDDDKADDSFRLDYGVHALKQGFMNKSQFVRLMSLVALPGALLTFMFRNTVLGSAGPFGLSALFFYTILFKPFALGEVLIYLVWGPLMAGFGEIAAGGLWTTTTSLFSNPATAQFGLAALCMIMGKHTDKITRSDKNTLPKVLGYPAALFACGATVLAPHILMLATFLKERVLSATTGGGVAPTLPIGAGLAFFTLVREVPVCLKIFRLGKPKNKDTPPIPWGTRYRGSVADFQVNRAWPLWFVAACGWHAVTFLYLMVIGSGLEWGGRAICSRLLV